MNNAAIKAELKKAIKANKYYLHNFAIFILDGAVYVSSNLKDASKAHTQCDIIISGIGYEYTPEQVAGATSYRILPKF